MEPEAQSGTGEPFPSPLLAVRAAAGIPGDRSMTISTTRSSAADDPVLLLLFVGWLALEAAAVIAVALIALLITLFGPRRPAASQQPLEQASAPLPVVITPALPPAPSAPSLEALPVARLRAMAREAGLPRQLSHSGRKADLLIALAGA